MYTSKDNAGGGAGQGAVRISAVFSRTRPTAVAGRGGGGYPAPMIPSRIAPAVLVFLLALAGCSQIERLRAPAPQAGPAPGDAVRPVARPGSGAAARIAPVAARGAEAFDTTTEAERAAAIAPVPAGGQELGRVVASLGNPAEPGFWLSTALVDRPRPGTVRLGSGTSAQVEAQVELRPASGGGAQLSLAAFRALDLGLTDLPELVVSAR